MTMIIVICCVRRGVVVLVSAAAPSRVLLVGLPCFPVRCPFLILPPQRILALLVAERYIVSRPVFASDANEARSRNDAKVKAPLLLYKLSAVAVRVSAVAGTYLQVVMLAGASQLLHSAMIRCTWYDARHCPRLDDRAVA